ncbi:CMP-sialic acid transporter isoform X1 [Erinaceus europaeus]|uniref:CMP-sialic acid transporter isoform X1 n=1 Tax=Erinaceus europaeus TaxID=9365 RepID=A0ABM3YK86_ERIEU|nr:CMP-sialic acid transporter isoform X1 [Erinaceus europaeus]
MKLSVPSLVYAVQNNMAFLALSNLDAAVYQVTYQLKIPCTALCTVLMLNRTLSKLQWIAIFMLCGGVTLVQWKPAQATKVMVEQNPLLGFGAIAIAVLCSGFAGVYFEKVLKSSDTSLWVRNIQMYLSGIAVTLVGVYLSDGAEIKEKGFFYGYTYYVWFVIFLASVGGLYTSVVVKYTDNIMKGFSAAAAIVLSTIASVVLFGLQINGAENQHHHSTPPPPPANVCLPVLEMSHSPLLWVLFLYVFLYISMDYPDKTLHPSNKEKLHLKRESLVCDFSLKRNCTNTK